MNLYGAVDVFQALSLDKTTTGMRERVSTQYFRQGADKHQNGMEKAEQDAKKYVGR